MYRTLAALIISLAAGPVAASAQVAVELSETPLTLASAGLTMRLPVGTETQVNEAGAVVSASCAPPDQSWLLSVETRYSSNRELTAPEIAASVLEELKARYGRRGASGAVVHTEVEVLLEEEVVTTEGAGAGGRFYISLPGAAGKPRQMRMYTIFQPRPGAFVSFDMVCLEPEYEHAREAYEVSVATAEFTDPALVSAARHVAIEAGASFLASLSDEDFLEAIQRLDGRLERLYTPAATGADIDATELGYRRYRARVGKRGEIHSGAGRGGWGAVENEEGYIVQLDFRLLQPGRTIIDGSGVFFLSKDRTREAWELRTAIKPHQAAESLFVERGIREDGDKMTVTVTPAGGQTAFHQPQLPEEGYLSQLEVQLLPVLLTIRPVSAEYGFYAYASRSNTVRFREADVARIAQGPARWSLSSKAAADGEPEVFWFSDARELLRINLPDGRIWAPVAPEKLQALWKQKNLPG